jgi:predicted nucleic acid-binding protein
VYDSLFVEVAIRTGRRLATFDGALLRAFPDIAAQPDELLEQ